MLVLRTSTFQGATIRPIVPRHKHSIVVMNYGAQVRFAPSRFAPTQSLFAPTELRVVSPQLKSRFAPTQSRFAQT